MNMKKKTIHKIDLRNLSIKISWYSSFYHSARLRSFWSRPKVVEFLLYRARAFWIILKYTWNRTWVKYTWNATPFWKIKLKFTSNFKYTSNYSVPFWIRNVLETWNLRLGTWREKQLSPAFTQNTLSRKQSNLSSRLKKKDNIYSTIRDKKFESNVKKY